MVSEGANEAARTLADSWVVTLLRGSQFLFAFLSLLVTTRALGPVGRAQYALPLTFAALISIGLGLSMDQSIGRMLALKSSDLRGLAQFMSAWTLCAGALATVVTVLLGLLTGEALLGGASTTVVLVAAAGVLPSLATQMVVGLLFRIGALREHALIVAGVGAGQVAVMALVAITVGLTPLLALIILVASLLLTAVALTSVLARRTGIAGLVPKLAPGLLRRALTDAWPLHLTTLAIVMNLRLDLFLVSLTVSTYQTGLYSLSVALAESVFLVPYILTITAMPTQTAAHGQRGARYTSEFARQTFAIGILAAVTAVVVAYPAVQLLYGAEWTASIVPFTVLATGAVAFALEGPIRTYLTYAVEPSRILRAAAAGMLTNVVLVVTLTPALGIVGAALGSLVSYWIYTCLILRLYRSASGEPLRSILAVPQPTDVLPRAWRRLRTMVS